MFNKHLIPNVENLPEGQALSVNIEQHNFLITKYDGQILAYKNLCPHQNKPLSHSTDCAFDGDGDYLKCTHHGALFSPKDGTCITGPCQGSQLAKATVGMHQGDCYLLLA